MPNVANIYPAEARFGFAGTALGFRRKMLGCLIAKGHEGRQTSLVWPLAISVLFSLPDVGLS